MCGICIAGLCIPYPALLPMLLLALQWTMTQLARIGLKLPGIFATDSPTAKDAPEKPPQHRIENEVCDDLWCFCLTSMGRKASSGNSPPAYIDSSSSEGSDSESDDAEEADQPDDSTRQLVVAPTLERPNRRNQQMRKRRMNSTPAKSFVPGEWCLPCAEIIT
ncbi:hypothetical protein ACHAXA_011915 [Cyclostephanos tholiformis]|uniref:Secreted protein n=1 Tax=Cyclostephanos tholiformis TaxID=382380 RepID=A0ABD3SC86_9STRA